MRAQPPDPQFARALQHPIGGVEVFQALGARRNPKFRDMLMTTAMEKFGHIEMLATAVALNREGARVSV